MKTLLLIGIGPGGTDALTLNAARAIARLDVLFLLDKAGPGGDALIRFRLAPAPRRCPGRNHRPNPERRRDRRPDDLGRPGAG